MCGSTTRARAKARTECAGGSSTLENASAIEFLEFGKGEIAMMLWEDNSED